MQPQTAAVSRSHPSASEAARAEAARADGPDYEQQRNPWQAPRARPAPALSLPDGMSGMHMGMTASSLRSACAMRRGSEPVTAGRGRTSVRPGITPVAA